MTRLPEKWFCRFNFPIDPHGFKFIFDHAGSEIIGVDKVQTETNAGAEFHRNELKFLRNHPTVVHHVPELLLLWGANIEGRPVQSYKQVLRYLLKYMFKDEPNSSPFQAITKAVIEATADEEPVRRLFQRLLMKTVGEHDLSKQECHHILAGTGKTYWLNTVRELARQTIGSQFIKRAAPSGTAAFLIGGETLHSLLYLPIGKAKLEPLGGERLMELQRKFEHVGILMVDEKSMMGQEMLGMVTERLIQAMSIKTSILATCPSFCLAIGNNYPLLGIPHSTSPIQRNPGDSTCTSCLTMLSSST